MKKLVISLKRRTDRKKQFYKNNLTNYQFIEAIDYKRLNNFIVDEEFRDPFKNRPVLKSEVACFLSHKKAWEKCLELNKPVIILEDDAVINETWDETYYTTLIDKYNFIYLQKNENEPDKLISIDDKLEIPSYPYNLTGYIIKPLTAKILINNIKKIIPVDEYVPRLIKEKILTEVVSLKKDSCNQMSRDESPSDIEVPGIARNFTVHPVTVGTDRKKCVKLNTSARHFGIDVKNLGTNVEWQGTDMTGPGGGHKVTLLREYLETLPNEDIVLFTDAYDVFYADDLETITERFLDFNCKVLFSAELYCYPDANLEDKFPESPTKYRFLNSGTFIGNVRELKRMFSTNWIANDADDQLYYQKLFISGEFDIQLDYEGYIFQTHEPNATRLNNQLFNPVTGCCACIYHGNGGDLTKKKFEQMYDRFFPKQESLFIPPKDFEILDDDILLVDFMTQEQCERMIEIADSHGGWGALSYDKFPAQEIRLKELGLWEELSEHWEKHIVPIVEKYWKPMEMYGLRDAFVMRYSVDTQKDLPLHTDASLVTGSIKLNDDYEGADLVYPRQNFSNKDIPIGKCILFPGQVSHGHACQELTKGTKYSFTIWSSRYPGDLL
jgi:GR25 family glycosyltransferase involved in LPS biosynthesis